MMMPKPFNGDAGNRRNWKDDVLKYFDEEFNGMKAVMNKVAKLQIPIGKDIFEQACAQNPMAVGEKLQHWKHLFRALEKLTEVEPRKVSSTVRQDGFEACGICTCGLNPNQKRRKTSSF